MQLYVWLIVPPIADIIYMHVPISNSSNCELLPYARCMGASMSVVVVAIIGGAVLIASYVNRRKISLAIESGMYISINVHIQLAGAELCIFPETLLADQAEHTG